MTNSQAFIERAEEARDLKTQLSNLGKEEDKEFQFYEWSPGRTNVDLWSLETGEKITLPRYMAEGAIYLRNAEGKYRFTSRAEQAPPVRVNTVRCFLHRESPERAFLVEMGIIAAGEIGCSRATLANEASKWTHARNRHASRYEQYRTEIERREREDDRALQRQQAQAMLTLAGGNVPAGKTSLNAPVSPQEGAEPPQAPEAVPGVDVKVTRGPGRPRKEEADG